MIANQELINPRLRGILVKTTATISLREWKEENGGIVMKMKKMR
jgi:hypothetical protein